MTIKEVVAAYLVAMSRWDNATLAAFNSAAQGFGRVSEQNIAYQVALDAHAINEDGKLVCAEVLEASTKEVNRRVDAGVFV